MSNVEIKCAYSELIPIENIKFNPKNRNKHSKSQIERLAKLIEYYGVRHPAILDNDNTCWVGEGRVLAMKKLGMKEIPVDRQNFKNIDEAQQFGISDNEIARWAEPNLAAINLDILNWGPDFDIDMLGIEDFKVDPAEKEPVLNANLSKKWIVCPHCERQFDPKKAEKVEYEDKN